MATKTVLDAAAPADKELREEIGVSATFEASALLEMLGRERGNDGFDLVLHSALARLKDLNSVAMSVLSGDDEKRETSEMHAVVFGKTMEVGHG